MKNARDPFGLLLGALSCSHWNVLCSRPFMTNAMRYRQERSARSTRPSVLEILRGSVENTLVEAADFFICGPADFLRILVTGLVEAGVEQEPVHDGYFGLGDDSMAA